MYYWFKLNGLVFPELNIKIKFWSDEKLKKIKEEQDEEDEKMFIEEVKKVSLKK